MKKISIGEYNHLYNMTENVLQKSWFELGLTLGEVTTRATANTDLQKLSQLPQYVSDPTYCLYKKNANELVDKILKQLGIEVEGFWTQIDC